MSDSETSNDRIDRGLSEVDLERQLLAVREQFQRQQADLLLQYQEKYAQLTLQHAQDSQYLVQEYLLRSNDPNHFAHVSFGGEDALHIADVHSGRTISNKTKEKLKEMIYSKHKQSGRMLDNPSGALYEPYPRQYRNDNELRKATSEPNLKMKGVQALRAKLIEKQQSRPSNTNRAGDPPSSSSRPAAKQPSLEPFFGAPSLPNMFSTGQLSKLRADGQPSSSLATYSADNVNCMSSPSLFNVVPYWLSNLVVDQTNSLKNDQQQQQTPIIPPISTSCYGQFNLLHAQIRDLVLRRKSLVKEESEDDVRREVTTLAACTETLPNVRNKTGLAYDSAMCRHQCTCGDNSKHVEHGGRIQSIWARLNETGLTDRCERILTRKAPLDYLRTCHSVNYCTFFGVSPTACLKMDPADLPLKSFVQLPCGGIGVDSDTYFNDSFTPSAVRAAVGSAVELCLAVAGGRLKNGFAVVRPPGHHAEPTQALGFCYFNNVAVATKVVQQKFSQLVKKVAIIDWDVHHGNGTQMIFESDPDVLYLSLHRHDDGNFFPGTGSVDEIGKGSGRGFTVNIPWSGEPMGDAEYLAAWRCVVDPVLEQFKPDMILVSCGFDAARGHWNAVGGYDLSSFIFGWMTKSLLKYAEGRVVLILEGGYNLASISDAAESCVRRLLARGGDDDQGEAADKGEAASTSNKPHCLDAVPNRSAQRTLRRVVEAQRQFWPLVQWEPALLSANQWTNAKLRRKFEHLTVNKRSPTTQTGEEGIDVVGK